MMLATPMASAQTSAELPRAVLTIGRAAPWVKPSGLPGIPASTDGKIPFRLILSDQQAHFHGDTTSLYTRRAFAVLTAEGLPALARVSVEWNPETDRVTIHALTLHRGAHQIDLLKTGQPGTLLRRRPGAQEASIDGTVAASLPVSGLAVGDVVDLSYTIERAEPLLAGHHDLTLDAGTRGGIERMVIAASWDKALPIAIATRNLPAPVSVTDTAMQITAGPVAPLPLPEGAPDRFRRGREVTFSDYRNWGEVAAIFTPLFAEARQIPANSPLQAEIARIKATSPDPQVRAALALALAEDAIRYLYVGLAQGNLRPASADLTFARGFGDCKGKAALLLALLDGLGINAEPAMVSVGQGDGLAERLPNVSQFDHVIIRATIAGRGFWLDPTRTGDTSLASLPVPDFHWALPLHTGADALVAITVPAPQAPSMVHDIRLDATRGISLPALAHATMTMTGDIARTTHALLARIPDARRTDALTAVWQRQYPQLAVTSLSREWSEASQTLVLSLDGTARLDWNLSDPQPHYVLARATLGSDEAFARSPGPEAQAPFALPWPDFTEQRETLILPGTPSAFHLAGENINQTLANRNLFRKVERHGNIITMVAHTRPLSPELPYAEAQAAAAVLHHLAESPVTISVNARAYVQTAEEARVAKAGEGGETPRQGRQIATSR